MSNAKGITRKLDDVGRITLPKEYRDTFNLLENDRLDILAFDNGSIMLTPLKTQCIFNKNHSGKLVEISDGKYVCAECAKMVIDKFL